MTNMELCKSGMRCTSRGVPPAVTVAAPVAVVVIVIGSESAVSADGESDDPPVVLVETLGFNRSLFRRRVIFLCAPNETLTMLDPRTTSIVLSA